MIEVQPCKAIIPVSIPDSVTESTPREAYDLEKFETHIRSSLGNLEMFRDVSWILSFFLRPLYDGKREREVGKKRK